MPAPRISRLWWFTGPVLVGLVATAAVLGTVRLPYIAFRPGGARAVEPLVEIVGRDDGPEIDAEDPTEDLLYVTVSTSVEPSGLVVLLGLLDDKVQVEPSEPYLGTQSTDDNRKLNLELMTDSQDKARKVSLERLGYEVGATPVGAFLEDVDPDFPAAAVLAPGMTIVGAGGREVATREDLVEEITALEPGDDLALEVVPLGSREPEQVVARLGERPGAPGTAALGVSLVDRFRYEFPVDIRIDTGKVGGPSAGLSFTLAILDRMTPGRLTGGETVAVTGTIELDGSVGPVGGVEHKTEAAIREGATLFLVPPQELEVAQERSQGRIEVRAVSTLDEALAALEEAGGDPLPEVER